jgi:hypothetical protein
LRNTSKKSHLWHFRLLVGNPVAFDGLSMITPASCLVTKCKLHYSQWRGGTRSMTTQEVNAAIRQSLGLPAKTEPVPTVPQEGHVCEFPFWSFSKQRSSEKKLHITYEDGSFLTIRAPEGMPSPGFPGYLDVILFYGQRDLFLQDHTSLSVYSILKTLEMDPHHSGNYAHFRRDMQRAFY